MDTSRTLNTLWTSIFDILTFVINGSIATYLARQFGPETFSQYIIITSFISVFTLFTRGIQTSVAQIYSNELVIQVKKNNTRFSSEKQALMFGLMISALWLLFIPFLVTYGKVALWPALSATVIPPATSVFAVAIGRLQGRGRFFHWRVALLISTSLQIPLVVIADLFDSPLSVFVIILVVPTSIIAIFEIRFSRPTDARSIEHRLKPSIIPGLISVLTMSATQLPLIYIRHEVPHSQSASLIIFVYISGLFIGISSTLGFFMMTKYKPQGNLSFNVINHHLINSIPLVLFLFFYFPLGNNLVGLIIGSSFELKLSILIVVYGSISSILWCIFSSLIYERLNVFDSKFVIGLAALVTLEFIVINQFGFNVEIFFLCHACFALVSITFALFSTK